MKEARKVNDVKLLRLSYGYTQGDIAKFLNVHISTYTKKENGQLPFSLKEIRVLKEFYNLDNDEVVEIFLNNKVG